MSAPDRNFAASVMPFTFHFQTLWSTIRKSNYALKGTTMLEIRPNCEWCDKDLPPDSYDARICSYECTYCSKCVEAVLHNVCATCGGGFVPRPIRPMGTHRKARSLGLKNQPASALHVHSKWTRDQIDELSLRLRDVPPAER